MKLITENDDLAAFCARQATAAFITVDTEFLRERTYWPELCLVQIGGPDEAAAIDALAPGLDLAPLMALMQTPDVLKVFHAARQDVEIFHHLSGVVPTPIFDTQIAAMVCGYGDSVSYETLAGKLAGARIDKSSRFTDWTHRPLTEKQLAYALADVTHLRKCYEALRDMLESSGRTPWLADEVAILTDPGTYLVQPEDAWRRLKTRGGNRRFMAILREVAAWRERVAQARDIPRSRVIRDEALLEIASHAPTTVDDLARVRSFGRGAAEGRHGTEILECVIRASTHPSPEPISEDGPKPEIPAGLGPLIDLLRVLLKLRGEESGVAQRLIANAADLELIAASDNADLPALTGWRHEIFGRDALALKKGKLALTADGKKIRIVPLD